MTKTGKETRETRIKWEIDRRKDNAKDGRKSETMESALERNKEKENVQRGGREREKKRKETTSGEY